MGPAWPELAPFRWPPTAFIVFAFSTKKVHQIWAIFNVIVAVWGLTNFIAGMSSTPERALIFWRLTFLPLTFISVVFYHVVIEFCQIKRPRMLSFTYIQGFLFLLVIIFFNNFINSTFYAFGSIYYYKTTLLFNIWTIPWYVITGAAFFELYRFIKRSHGTQKTQALYMFWAMLLGHAGGSTTILPAYNVLLYPVWHVSICFYTAICTYAIFKHQFMDINIIIRRSLIYSCLVFVITLLFFISIFISERLFHYVIHYQDIRSSIIIAGSITLIFTPLKNKIQDLVDRAFFKATPMEIANQNEKLKAVATLASGLAHEIKNPLTTLKTFAEYVPIKKDDPEFMKQYQKIMPQEIDRIDNLVHELLYFAKPSLPQIQSINPNEIITNVILMLKQKFDSSNINVILQLNANTTIQADPNQLKQALLNLILNAIDAMPNGGILTIETSVTPSSTNVIPAKAGILNHQYIVTITDTGHGINPKDLPHIFEPFFTKKEKGTGLGLAITQGIIEKHNGTVKAESKINQGTIFKIIFLLKL